MGTSNLHHHHHTGEPGLPPPPSSNEASLPMLAELVSRGGLVEGQDIHHCPVVMRPPLNGVDGNNVGNSNEALLYLPAKVVPMVAQTPFHTEQ